MFAVLLPTTHSGLLSPALSQSWWSHLNPPCCSLSALSARRFREWHGDSGSVGRSVSLPSAPRAGEELCHEVKVWATSCRAMLYMLHYTILLVHHHVCSWRSSSHGRMYRKPCTQTAGAVNSRWIIWSAPNINSLRYLQSWNNYCKLIWILGRNYLIIFCFSDDDVWFFTLMRRCHTWTSIKSNVARDTKFNKNWIWWPKLNQTQSECLFSEVSAWMI